MSPARRQIGVLMAAVIAFSAPAGCAKKKPAASQSTAAVATINGTPVTVEEFALEWNTVRGTAAGIAPIGVHAAHALKRDLLDRLLDRRLALAAAKGKVTVTDDEVKQEIAEMRSGYADDHFNETMVDGLMTHETLARRVRERVTVDRYFQEVVFGGIAADDREVEDYLREHLHDLDRPETVRVQHIVVKTEEEMAHIRERLRAGEQFGDLARRFSSGPEAKAGGELPPYARNVLPQVFDAAFRVPVGQVSEPEPSPYGYHLFKVLEKRPAAPAPPEEAAASARLKVLERKKRATQERWYSTARAGAVVAVKDEVLDAIP